MILHKQTKAKKMNTKKILICIGLACVSMLYTSCTGRLSLPQRTENKETPASYKDSQDTTNMVKQTWKEFFTDPNLAALIDTALMNNQELNITLQEIQIAKNEVKARKGEYLPFVGVGAVAGVEKEGRYTSQGASDATTEYKPGKTVPDPLGDYKIGFVASWELDIWKKLRNAKKAAAFKYLASIDGKNFMVTHLISEIANLYYELMALDNQLEILNQNIEIQTNALKIVKLEKDAARVTELAVRKFEAEVYKNRSRQFEINQKIIETENKINFLVGRFPKPIQRNSQTFPNLVPDFIFAGVPSQLLINRPDIRQAENDLLAAKLNVKVARAAFYPSLRISAGLGYQAFNPMYFLKTPESLIYSLAGDLMAPLFNRNAIKAAYFSANNKQIQAVIYTERLYRSI
jgi:outer membrane protein, multidrug efflux system